jgi:hypothetical protein
MYENLNANISWNTTYWKEGGCHLYSRKNEYVDGIIGGY